MGFECDSKWGLHQRIDVKKKHGFWKNEPQMVDFPHLYACPVVAI